MTVDIFDEPVANDEVVASDKPTIAKWWWLVVIAVLFVFVIRGCGGRSDDRSIVNVDGLHVLVVEDVNARDSLPTEQAAIFNSIDLRSWYQANCVEDGYRNYDVDDSLENEPEVWRRMRAGLTLEPPAMIVANGRKGAQMPLPANPDAMIRELNKFKRRR